MKRRSDIKPIIYLILILAVVTTTAGCRVKGGIDYETVIGEARGGEESSFIMSVPFFPDDEYMCGPAAMAGVLGFYDDRITLSEVRQGVFSHIFKGTLTMDMLLYAKKRGYRAEYYKSSFDDLKSHIKRDEPLILFLNLGIEEKPRGHFITVTGYHDTLRVVIANDGLEERKVITYEDLEEDWGKTGYSAILILPPSSGE